MNLSQGFIYMILFCSKNLNGLPYAINLSVTSSVFSGNLYKRIKSAFVSLSLRALSVDFFYHFLRLHTFDYTFFYCISSRFIKYLFCKTFLALLPSF